MLFHRFLIHTLRRWRGDEAAEAVEGVAAERNVLQKYRISISIGKNMQNNKNKTPKLSTTHFTFSLATPSPPSRKRTKIAPNLR